MKTILVVDDKPDIIELVKNRLEANNYKVIVASDGNEGIKQAQQHKPDLIVMDIMMPNVSGGEAVKVLKSDPATHHIPVVFLTAVGSSVREGEEPGRVYVDGQFFPAISKPFKPEKLLSEIRKLIGN
jgi:twitching motility two-component system response regulator PilH